MGDRHEISREADRLWQLLKRDYFYSLEMFAGISGRDDATRLDRFDRNFKALCRIDIDFASALAHGFDEMNVAIQQCGNPSGPLAHNLRTLSELIGVATIGRDANPDAKVATLGELLELGEEVIRADIDSLGAA